jgi:hypothetical protein
MKLYVVIVLFAWLLTGCQGSMKVLSASQEEVISLAYKDSMETRDVRGVSTSGESFSGSLLWTKGQRNSGKYRGVLVGENGRTLQVALGCNALKRKCAGTAKDNNGSVFFVF